ncbi:NACHT, LRR and PYD domains-containing protein 1 homolog [Pseudorasbora parva]|uniref:NACHT, LRR and PYD domains-containing protein 1 homolog n=1 Tax=Pseudorasbora parva TaxID=51549 RepID=UPI00351EA3F5
MECSFLSREESFSALYIEPVIMQKHEKDRFKRISVNELLDCFWFASMLQNDPVNIILRGDSSSGKSFIAQKIMLDWASERFSSRPFIVVFYLRCEELMCISEEMNLIELLSSSCSLTSNQISQMLQHLSKNVLFIIDGFDELRFTQDIYDMSAHIHPLQKAPAEVIICGLMRRYIIPESTLLVTTRTKNTVNKLLKGQQHFTEIMGLSESQVEGYFQKFFRKEYDCVRANEALFTACSTPAICWIISEMFRVGAAVASGLETTTSIYVDFVSTLLDHHCQGLSQSVPTLLRSLGQLAERGMLEQQVLFDEKSVKETVSDPAGSPFLCKILSRRRIRQETMFSFKQDLSFQEFFAALYYVLLDEEESQRKVRKLLHAVERGWVLSCWSDRDFSMVDVEVRHGQLLQPVILFLCGLYQKEWSRTFFKKHNMAVSISIESQLEEWLYHCSQRYQNEHILFILHCLYELHEKSFAGHVLEGLILIDLSNILLKRTDCWVLKYCLQCCEHIRNLKLHVTSDNLKMLQPELYRCKELGLMMDHISDSVVGLVSSAGKGKILNKLIIKELENRVTVSVRDEDITLSFITRVINETSLTLTCPSSVVSTINWVKSHESALHHPLKGLWTLQSVSDLKKVCLQTSELTGTFACDILSLIQACPSLVELSLNFRHLNTMEIMSLKESLKQMGWTLTVWGNSVLIQTNRERFTVKELKMKKEKSESRSASTLSGNIPKRLSSAQSSTEDAKVFSPELLQGDDDICKKTYRFVCPYAGQFRCSLTNLVFVMEGRGEVLYKTVSWDPRLLDGLGQMQPAGPLYNIDCSAGSVSRLHFPHCEIYEESKDGLAVAHLTGGNIEIMQPLQATETHVMIDIRDLSIFGLLKRIFSPSPICGQVLVFQRPINVRQRENILDVHLLPWNVPLSEVKDQHAENTHIKTSSKCSLTPATEYSLCCQPEESIVQPETEIFECNFGPNYHPTFEVFVNVDTEEVKLSLLDKTNWKEVWVPRRILLTGKSGEDAESLAHRRLVDCEFVKKHRDKLVKRVSSVMAISDGLWSKDMIPDEMYYNIHSAKLRQEKTRRLLDALDSGGSSAKTEFYRLLKENEPYLVDELESGHSGLQ